MVIKTSKKETTIVSFGVNSQDRHWTESRNQAKQAVIKSYSGELTEAVNPSLRIKADGSKHWRKS
jgi:hypothetical protein